MLSSECTLQALDVGDQLMSIISLADSFIISRITTIELKRPARPIHVCSVEQTERVNIDKCISITFSTFNRALFLKQTMIVRLQLLLSS